MILSTKNNELLRSFIARTTDKEGKEYTIKVVSYKDPVATTSAHGDIHSGLFIEDKKGEILYTVLFQAILTDKEMMIEAEDRIKRVDFYVGTKTEEENGE